MSQHSGDWRDSESYVYTARFSLREWAWEFLRRNTDFIGDWKQAQFQYGFYGQEGTTTILLAMTDDLVLRKWSCLYASSPVEDSRSASVFWNPEICGSVLHLDAIPAIDAEAFTLHQIYSPSVVLELKDGKQHILFAHEGCWLQIAIEGADILKPGKFSLSLSPDRYVSQEKRRLLHCLDDLRFSGRIMSSHFQPTKYGRRLCFVVRALDGYLAGADHEEIAIALIGRKRVAADWKDPLRSLQDRVRRAISRGCFLMQGGYRKFLG
ncbi:MAG TPA: DUF2285 domain-containing protein [Terriglobales bacterium]|nr:DUF2285 domain-containing protein [Terriglobales bacterium]